MPGQHSDEERERKERIKKMKVKTSKMRLSKIIATEKQGEYGTINYHDDTREERRDKELKKRKSKEAAVKKKSSVYGDYLTPKEAKPAYKELFKKITLQIQKNLMIMLIKIKKY